MSDRDDWPEIITPPLITLKVATMGDYADECQRIWDERARREQEAQREVIAKADHYVLTWGFQEAMEALDESDEENQKRFLDLLRARDDLGLGLHVRQLVESYAYRIADGEI